MEGDMAGNNRRLTWWVRSALVGVLVAAWSGCVFADIIVPGPPPAPAKGDLAELIVKCAPTVHPDTMAGVISVESSSHQFAIADAGPVNLPWSQRKSMVRSYYLGSLAEAVEKAKQLIAAGHTVSLGLGQVNDRNLSKLGLSLEKVFDPCENLAAAGKILTNFYLDAVREFGPGDKALRAALSAYNSGDWLRGDREGYVDQVFAHAGRPGGVVKVPGPRGSRKLVEHSRQVGREFALGSSEFKL